MVSGNDAANMLADMLGGQRVAVAAMNAKAQQLGARNTHASSRPGLTGPVGKPSPPHTISRCCTDRHSSIR